MKPFGFYLPVKVIFGKGNILQLGNEISPRMKRVMIVTDPGLLENTGIIPKITKLMKGREVFTFSGIGENPTLEDVENGVGIAKGFTPELVIGVGGGSAMDAAKEVAKKMANPVACIPTTSGTGSEVTPFAVFTDTENQNKLGLSDPSYFPLFSIIDPELTYSMPEQVILNTGLDSLAHALEAYLSTVGSDLSDRLALRSIDLVVEHLAAAVRQKRKSMDFMSYSAMLSGMAIAHASTILPHIMGYPLTTFHKVPHGRAGMVLLPAFLNFLKSQRIEAEKVDVLDKKFRSSGGIGQFLNDLGVSCQLRDYGVKENELEDYVEKTIVKSDVDITPGKIDRQTIMDIYRSAY